MDTNTTQSSELIEEMQELLKDKFNRFVGFDTVDQSRILADFLNKNKELLRIYAIEREADLGQHTLSYLMNGRNRTIHPDSISRVLSILQNIKLEVPEEKKEDDDYPHVPVEKFEIHTNDLDTLITKIINTVCSHYNMPVEWIQRNSRKREIVQCRQICMYFLKKRTSLSLEKIGQKLAGRGHDTVISGIKTVNNLIETNKPFAEEIDKISIKIKQL